MAMGAKTIKISRRPERKIIMKNFTITESTTMSLNAVKAVKSGYMSILLPGEKRLYKGKEGDEERIAFGAAGRVSDTGEVFQVPVPFGVNPAELEAEDEEIAVNAAQFDKMIEMCARSGGSATTVSVEDGLMTFTSGAAKGSIRYFAPADIPYVPELETKGEPVVKLVVKSEAFMKRIRFVASFGADGMDIRITPSGKLKVLPSLFCTQIIAESECTPDEIIDMEYKKSESAVDVVIPSKYKDFFLSGVYGEKMTISVFEGVFTVSSGGANFKGSLKVGSNLIPENMLSTKMCDIKQYDVITAFTDRAGLVKDLGISQIWEEMVRLNGSTRTILRVAPNDKDDIAMCETDSYTCSIKAPVMKKSESAKEFYHFIGSDLIKCIGAFQGDGLTFGMTAAPSKSGDAGTIALLIDCAVAEKGMTPLGNRIVLLGSTAGQYEEMVKTCAVTASKTPKDLEKEAKEAAKKAQKKDNK